MIIIISLWTIYPLTPSKKKKPLLNVNPEFSRHFLEAPGPRRNRSWNLQEINIHSARRSLLQALVQFVVLQRSPNLLVVAGASVASRDFFRPYSLDLFVRCDKKGEM